MQYPRAELINALIKRMNYLRIPADEQIAVIDKLEYSPQHPVYLMVEIDEILDNIEHEQEKAHKEAFIRRAVAATSARICARESNEATQRQE